MNEQAMFRLTYGLFVLTVREGSRDNGCIINTVMQVTAIPNRIVIAVDKHNYTHEMLERTMKCNISVLSEDAEFDIFKHFGFVSGRDTDKFAGYDHVARSTNGIYYVTEGTNARLSAVVREKVDLGTHTLYIADVEDMDVLNDRPSATYAYYHAHIKPQPPRRSAVQLADQRADTDGRAHTLEETKNNAGETVWRCRICGYEYIGNELPDDYICPICKHPAADFEKVQ